MKITRTSQTSGITRTLEIPVTQAQIERCEAGELIQNVMPELTPDQREFLITGITPEEWDEIFEDDEDDDNWQPCDECDQPDACEDFGCRIENHPL